MNDDIIPRCILIAALVLLGGFFAGSETAFSNCNRVRMRSRAEDGNRAAKRVEKILDHFDKALVTLLIGNNVIHVIATSSATVLAIRWLGSYGSLVSTVVMTLTIFIFSETIPKSIAKANSDRIAELTSSVVCGLMAVCTPVSAVFTALSNGLKHLLASGNQEPSMTEDDFKSMIETIEDEGALESDESELIQSALIFSDITADTVLTPRVHITGLDRRDPEQVNQEKIRRTAFSRLPVYDPDMDHIVGILNTKTYLLHLHQQGDCCLEELMNEPYFVPSQIDIHTLFHEMSRRKLHMAIVQDQWGGTMGLVTMEDILESLMGDIWDDHDGHKDELAPVAGQREEAVRV